MVDDLDYALAQINEYEKSIMNLAHLSTEGRSNEIGHIGKGLEQLSKINIPDLDEKDHDPFSGVLYSINTSQSQKEIDEYHKWYEEQKIKLLVDFCKLKRSQIGMLKEKRKSSTNATSVSSPKQKDQGFFDKTKKIIITIGGIAGAILVIWQLWDKITGTISGG